MGCEVTEHCMCFGYRKVPKAHEQREKMELVSQFKFNAMFHFSN